MDSGGHRRFFEGSPWQEQKTGKQAFELELEPAPVFVLVSIDGSDTSGKPQVGLGSSGEILMS